MKRFLLAALFLALHSAAHAQSRSGPPLSNDRLFFEVKYSF